MTQQVSIPPFNPIPGKTDGSTTAYEAELKTTDNADHTLATFVLLDDALQQFDVEVVAIKLERTIGGWWKKSRAYLTKNAAITAGRLE